MKVIVDADACPVYKSVLRICEEKNIPCVLVCDFNHELKSDYAKIIVTDKGNDSTDFKIVSMLEKNDLVITQDYGLAALVMSKKANAMHHSGTIYTSENIDKLLFERFLSAKQRRGGIRTGNMKKFTKHDEQNFKDKFTNWIEMSKSDIKEKKEMTTIYLLRHGESEANLGDRFAGHTDANLTEKGFKQAILAGEYLNQYDIDVIYASPLKRAYNTAKPISELKKLPIITDEGLMEINGGGWENLSFAEIKAKFPDDYGLWMTDIGNARCNDGESLNELYNRVVKTVTKIATENLGKTICIATHATPIRVFECFSQGKDVSYTNDIEWVPNASVTAFSFDGQKFTQIFRAENSYLKDIATKLPTDI